MVGSLQDGGQAYRGVSKGLREQRHLDAFVLLGEFHRLHAALLDTQVVMWMVEALRLFFS